MLCSIVRHVGAVRNVKPLFKRWPESRLIVSSVRKFSDKKPDDEQPPIPYSKSEAAKWRAAYSRAPPDDRLQSEPTVVLACFAAILIYFCILREENDIDIMLGDAFPKLFAEHPSNLRKLEQKEHDHNKEPTV